METSVYSRMVGANISCPLVGNTGFELGRLGGTRSIQHVDASAQGEAVMGVVLLVDWGQKVTEGVFVNIVQVVVGLASDIFDTRWI